MAGVKRRPATVPLLLVVIRPRKASGESQSYANITALPLLPVLSGAAMNKTGHKRFVLAARRPYILDNHNTREHVRFSGAILQQPQCELRPDGTMSRPT